MPTPTEPGDTPAAADRDADVRRHRRGGVLAALTTRILPDRTADGRIPWSGWAWRATAALGVAAIVGAGLTLGTGELPSPPVDVAGDVRDDASDETADRSQDREEATPSEEPTTEAEPTETAEPEPAEPPAPVAGLDETQMANAVLVVEIGRDLGFDDRGQAVALVTAMQESLLRNVASDAVPESLDYPHEGVMVDYDSVGLFQQRPSMGWGTVEQCMDVEYATTTFYNALNNVSGWQDMALTQAAQAVQGSAFPDAYAQWEEMAWTVVDAL